MESSEPVTPVGDARLGHKQLSAGEHTRRLVPEDAALGDVEFHAGAAGDADADVDAVDAALAIRDGTAAAAATTFDPDAVRVRAGDVGAAAAFGDDDVDGRRRREQLGPRQPERAAVRGLEPAAGQEPAPRQPPVRAQQQLHRQQQRHLRVPVRALLVRARQQQLQRAELGVQLQRRERGRRRSYRSLQCRRQPVVSGRPLAAATTAITVPVPAAAAAAPRLLPPDDVLDDDGGRAEQRHRALVPPQQRRPGRREQPAVRVPRQERPPTASGKLRLDAEPLLVELVVD